MYTPLFFLSLHKGTRKGLLLAGEYPINYLSIGLVNFTFIKIDVDVGDGISSVPSFLARRVSSCTLAFISNVVFTCSLVLWTSSFFWCSKFARNLPEGALFCGDLWSFCGIIWRSLLAKSLPKSVGLYRKRSAKWLCTNSALPKSG